MAAMMCLMQGPMQDTKQLSVRTNAASAETELPWNFVTYSFMHCVTQARCRCALNVMRDAAECCITNITCKSVVCSQGRSCTVVVRRVITT